MKETEFTRPEDIVAHYGEDYDTHFGAMSPPIYQTSLFTHNGQAYDYSRAQNPTVDLAEEKLAALEHGERALLFSAGVAAITTALAVCVKAGDHVVMQRSSYGPAKRYVTYLEKFGVTHTFVDGRKTENIAAAITENTSVIYLESPGSQILEMQDLRAVAALAKEKGIVTIIDNTWATPLYQNPLDLGIDLVVHSCSKYIGGHSDIIGGVIVGNNPLINQIDGWRSTLGNIMAPTQAWLILRSLRTLPVRMERHSKNAMKVAMYLESHPKVTRVHYPALPSDPQHELFKAQMSGASGLMSFRVEGTMEQKREVFHRFKVFQRAFSWGGYDSLVSAPGIDWALSAEEAPYYGEEGLYRISVGLEDADTLIADLEQALSVL